MRKSQNTSATRGVDVYEHHKQDAQATEPFCEVASSRKKEGFFVSLLKEIQESAVEAGDVAVALRKSKILASRLNNSDFKKWVDSELNGYPDDDSLPDYRIKPAIAKGYFSGYAGSSLNNAGIPAYCLPEKFKDFARKVYIRQGIGSVEAIVGDATTNRTLELPWPPDLVALVGTKIYENMSCLSAWQELSTAAFVGIVEAVRSKLIDFVLEIERENPDAGEGKTPLRPERVAQIFQQVFNVSGNANIASGSENFSQYSSVEIKQGDLQGLSGYLKSLGLDDDDGKELLEALKSDPRPESRERLGPRVSKWLGKMATKAASGVWGVSLAAGSELLTRAILSYYGLK